MTYKIASSDLAFLRRIGGGSVAHGFEMAMKLARAAEEIMSLRQGERKAEEGKRG